MTDHDDTDTSDFVAENSDATNTPDRLRDDDDETWLCLSCGDEVTAGHDCEDAEE